MTRPRSRVELNGALTLVTGAGSGIGRATAHALAREGARVVSVDIALDRAEKTAAECGEIGQPAWALACDVASFEDVEALGRRVFDEHGIPDVVVNNAGVGISGPLTEMTIDDWRWIRSINLDGVVHGCRVFGPPMLRRGTGHVVNTASGFAYIMHADEPAYVTTKAAVLALSRCLQADWSRHGVGVSAICPGVVNTAIVAATRFAGEDPERRRRDAQRLFRRGHKPETVADAVIDAIRRNRLVVPVGWEAKLGWGLQRALPVAVAQVFARQGRS
jgi:2-hydroxycyclohexanecarboxyl-CoA dehydrogenase